MLIVYTQNKALVNISNFENIYATQNDDNNLIITNGTVVLGQYQTQRELVTVMDWLANIIGNSNPNMNTVVTMPYQIEVGDFINETDTREIVGEVPTEEN